MKDPFFDDKVGVLINKWGLQDPELLQRRETFHSANRMDDLPKVRLTFAGYKKLHQHIFQDVYPWAGQIRPTPLAKGTADGGVVTFLPPSLIEPNLRRIFGEIGEGKALRGLSPEQFAEKAADVLDQVNHAHAFREGNGRTQRALLWRMGEVSGHRIDLRRISPEGWMAASIASDVGRDHRPMQELIRGAFAEPGPGQRPGRAEPT